MGHNEKMVIGYDIDGVIANFVKGFYDLMGAKQPDTIPQWSDPFINDNFDHVIDNDEFWSNLPLINRYEGQEVDIYITARPCPSHISRRWLVENGWPDRLVMTVGHNNSKIDAAKSIGLTHFIDDKPENVDDLLSIGVDAKLYEPYYMRHENPDFTGKLPINPFR